MSTLTLLLRSKAGPIAFTIAETITSPPELATLKASLQIADTMSALETVSFSTVGNYTVAETSSSVETVAITAIRTTLAETMAATETVSVIVSALSLQVDDTMTVVETVAPRYLIAETLSGADQALLVQVGWTVADTATMVDTVSVHINLHPIVLPPTVCTPITLPGAPVRSLTLAGAGTRSLSLTPATRAGLTLTPVVPGGIGLPEAQSE